MTRAVAPTESRLIVKRGGSAITSKVPRPTVLVDTREQNPFQLSRFKNWIGGERVATLETGDYTIEGMEHLVCLERKSLPDLVRSLTQDRQRFLRQLERMKEFPHKAILVEATYEEMKSPYTFAEGIAAHPNGICGSCDALEARYGLQIIYTASIRALAEEKAASWLSKTYTYWWLETNGFGRFLQEGDL